MIYIKLFLSFMQVGLFSVGGGYAAIPLIQNQVIQNHWMTLNEFTDLISIAEMTPGPIAVNSATFVGIRTAGLLGAIIATTGCIFPSCILVTLLAYLYQKYRNIPILQNILGYLRPVIVALILSAGFSILFLVIYTDVSGVINWIGIGIFSAGFIALRKAHINPIIILILSGTAGLILYQLI